MQPTARDARPSPVRGPARRSGRRGHAGGRPRPRGSALEGDAVVVVEGVRPKPPEAKRSGGDAVPGRGHPAGPRNAARRGQPGETVRESGERVERFGGRTPATRELGLDAGDRPASSGGVAAAAPAARRGPRLLPPPAARSRPRPGDEPPGSRRALPTEAAARAMPGLRRGRRRSGAAARGSAPAARRGGAASPWRVGGFERVDGRETSPMSPVTRSSGAPPRASRMRPASRRRQPRIAGSNISKPACRNSRAGRSPRPAAARPARSRRSVRCRRRRPCAGAPSGR